MFLEDIKGKWKSVSVEAQCDECQANYRAKISTALRQEKIVGHHQCRSCSSRRAGKKTAAKMSEIYSQWYSGDGNFAKKPGVGEKISKAQTGKKLSEAHKQSLRKPKRVTDKVLEARKNPELIKFRSERMIKDNPCKRPEVREKISQTVSNLYATGKYDVPFYNRMKTGWVSTNKTPQPIWCRSGLEKEFLHKASECAKIQTIESAEKLRIIYEYKGAKHKYLPDFKITMIDGISLIVEIKSTYFALEPKWEFKKIALHDFCDVFKLNYLILSEKEIDKWIELLKE